MPIPMDSKLVHDWVIFKVRQRQQEMFDWSYATFERATRYDSVFCIPVFWDKICMVNEQQPQETEMSLRIMWGRVDKWLTPDETMIEELSEELGAECELLEVYLPCKIQGKLEYTQYMYIAKWCKITHEQHLDPWGEKIELVYVTFDEFVDYVCSEKCNLLLFSNYVMRLKLNGQLDHLKQAIFW